MDNDVLLSSTEIPIMKISSADELLNYIGEKEISQEGNLNAYTRLFHRTDDIVVKLYVSNFDTADKNIETIQAIYSSEIMYRSSNLAIPISLIECENQIIGYTMPYIEGMTLEEALENKQITHREKLGYFKQMAKVICSLPSNIHIADLHGKNVIIDAQGDIYFIDMDGFEVEGIHLHEHDYVPQHILHLPDKYYRENVLQYNFNYDVWCWFDLFFKYIIKDYYWMSLGADCQNDYLLFLEEKGIEHDFIESAKSLFDKSDNLFSEHIIDSFPEDDDVISFNTFLQSTYWTMKFEHAECWIKKYICSAMEVNDE